MQVWITLDTIDGTASRVKGPVHVDEIDLQGLLFALNRADVAGVTFTRANPLGKVMNPDWRCTFCGAINKHGSESCVHCNAG